MRVSWTRPPLCLYLALLLCAYSAFLPSRALASQDSGSSSSKDKKENKKKSAGEADRKASAQERNYQKIKQFSVDEYQKNSEFKAEVDDSLQKLQRDHSEIAFEINTRDADDEVVTRSGDKIKIQDTLYDNPLVQDYVNRVGQSLVPKQSPHLYAFRVTLNPVPEARALSTGTVYVSTGLLSFVDNEAQLSYILAHEIAHIEKEHWREDLLVDCGLERYNEKQQTKRNLIGNLANIGASLVGGGGYSRAMVARYYALHAIPSVVKLTVPDATTSWDRTQEDEADQIGLRYMFERNYDPREVPKLFAALERTAQRERRATTGFVADPLRIAERATHVASQIVTYGSLSNALFVGAVNLDGRRRAAASAPPAASSPEPGKTFVNGDVSARKDAVDQALGGTTMASELRAKLDAGLILGSMPQFETVMAEIKRDNGIRAYYYDMFWMARTNLEESIMIRSNDPYAHLYHGKVLKLTARTAAEKNGALSAFAKAINLDRRRVLPEPYLHRALMLMDAKDMAQSNEIVASLKDYIQIYQRMHGGALPPNVDVIYSYLQEVGDTTWSAAPVMPAYMTQPVQNTAPAPREVVQRADPAAAPEPAKPPARRSGKRKP